VLQHGLGARRAGAGARDEVEGAGALAVEAEVFGEGLGDGEFEGVAAAGVGGVAGGEVADCGGVVVGVACCEALAGSTAGLAFDTL
jgi:hypothetical protein